MISNAATATATVTTSNAAHIYIATTPANRSHYLSSDKEAVVLRTGKASTEYHEVTGPKQYRVSQRLGTRYTGPENDFHTDDQQEAIAHANRYVGNKLS